LLFRFSSFRNSVGVNSCKQPLILSKTPFKVGSLSAIYAYVAKNWFADVWHWSIILVCWRH